MGRCRYRDADKVLKLGGLNRNDTANIMLGMALFNQKRLEQARRAFQSAVQRQPLKAAANAMD